MMQELSGFIPTRHLTIPLKGTFFFQFEIENMLQRKSFIFGKNTTHLHNIIKNRTIAVQHEWD